MRGQNEHDLWTVIFLIAVLLQDSLLAIVNTEDAMTKKQATSSREGNYYLFLACQRVTSNFYINLSFNFAKIYFCNFFCIITNHICIMIQIFKINEN